jgi:hypothetical protein
MEKWHLWFAWYPIFINVGNPDPTITFVWLEKVYRKREYTLSYNGYNWEWNYTREYRIFNRG